MSVSDLKRVPLEVPMDCDVVVFTSYGSKLLKKEKVADFLLKVLQNCPCQDQMASCPYHESTDLLNVKILFDCHSQKFESWPFKLKYVCNVSQIDYRHYHESEWERISCRLANGTQTSTS